MGSEAAGASNHEINGRVAYQVAVIGRCRNAARGNFPIMPE